MNWFASFLASSACAIIAASSALKSLIASGIDLLITGDVYVG